MDGRQRYAATPGQERAVAWLPLCLVHEVAEVLKYQVRLVVVDVMAALFGDDVGARRRLRSQCALGLLPEAEVNVPVDVGFTGRQHHHRDVAERAGFADLAFQGARGRILGTFVRREGV